MPRRLGYGRRSLVGRGLAAFAAAALIAGCSSTVLDTGQVEEQIRTQIEQQTGADVSAVACPDDVKASAGARFSCRVTGRDGSAVAITVIQTSDKGDLRFDAPLLHTTATEKAVAEDIGGGVRVDCPELVLVEAGTTFSCDLEGAGSGSVEITLKDAKGNFDYEVKP